jgi:pyruvate ferredoxin oxidoreductase alpha subunit
MNTSSNNNFIALTGGEAAAEAMRQIEPGVVPVYPITPQTPIVEKFAYFQATGKVKTEIITAESEHSVMSAAIGAAAAGVRAMTATSSAGLALMYEILGVTSGMRLPIVVNIANRAVSAPLNIHCDHSDTIGVRDTGWIQIFCETAQEVYDSTILAVMLAEHPEVLLPVMVNQDGFITSHLLENIEILSDQAVKSFVGEYHYPYSLLSQDKTKTFGTLMLPDFLFETKVAQAEAMQKAEEIYKEVADDFAKISQREHPKFELFQVDEDTEAVIITMSSVAGTAKAVAQKLAKKGQKVGVIKIKLFRPFPYEELGAIIKNVKSIAVLDRAFSFGSVPALYSEIVQTLYRSGSFASLRMTKENAQDDKRSIQSYIFGIGGRDLREQDIKEIYTDLLAEKFTPQTKFINLNSK